MLENVKFSAKQLAFIDWLACSRFDRLIPTQGKFAKEIGVTEQTLWRWKSLPGFREAIIARARELLGDDLSEIYAALRREAIKGSYQHIKLAMEMTGEYVERQEVTGADGGAITIKVVYDEPEIKG
jgi:hypothetical protein